jgi:hypothetical protein
MTQSTSDKHAHLAEPHCYGCGAPRSRHGADGCSMQGWPHCRRFVGERPSWYPAGEGIEKR